MNIFKKKKKGRKEKCIMTFARSWNTVAATRCLGKHGVEQIAVVLHQLLSGLQVTILPGDMRGSTEITQ